MPRSENQKLKLLYLLKILLTETDAEHGLSMEELLEKLAREGVNAERKSIYADFLELENYGVEVQKTKEGHNTYYRVVDRDFELSELKFLVDAVQAAKFITEKKSNELIKKLEKLTSIHNAKKLQRQVIISGRVKAMNESIYYSVDALHDAINNNRTVRFRYFNWNAKKEMVFRHDGAYYEISPWGLVWDDEYYYLIGYDAEAGKIKHYRVDKMKNISYTDNPREGRELFEKTDLQQYSRSLFGMFGGDIMPVRLECKNEFAGIIIDRFGTDIMMIPHDAEHFHVTVDVSFSMQFIGWVTSVSEGVKVIGPDKAVERMKEMIDRMKDAYK